MKKVKALTKRKVSDFIRSTDEIVLPETQPLDEEVILLDDVTLEDVIDDVEIEVQTDVTESEVSFAPPAADDTTLIDEPSMIQTDEASDLETTSDKRHFWQSFKRQIIQENIVIEHQPIEVKKEESQSMSFNQKSASYSNESAVISSTMVIKGDVELDTSLVCSGKIVGNVKCKDGVEFKKGGSIEGDVNAVSAEFVGGDVKGNVLCEDHISVDEETSIVGNLNAKDVVISGKVVGEVKATGSVKLMHSAVIKGDLFAASISIESGARLEGKFVVNTAE